ncbi:MAG: Cellulose-binding domain protein [Polyangiaceae bacterium]|jgi:hypothetical protein|nr:Cellulose-binding domain protein [Polyangiaceae bacterium]
MFRLGSALLLLGSVMSTLACQRGAAPAGTPRVTLAPDAKLLPMRARRLSNWEVERSVAAFTGTEVAFERELPPDVRQEGYTRNAAQDVSSTWATRYSALVGSLVPDAARALEPSLPCRDFSAPTCREQAAQSLGERAFRRPLEAEEVSELAALLESAGSLGTLLRRLLESASFLYVTELGPRLTNYELASQLSYLLQGGPPDAELFAAARRGELARADQRAYHARRLLAESDTRFQFRRFALEWLEVDGLLGTAKNTEKYPSYEALKPFMLAETEGYVDEVFVHGGASVHALLGSGFASVGPEMARFYGLATYGPRASLRGTGRLGVLQQASFLAAHAHEDVTSPVKRGDFVMRKLLCERLKRPAEIGLEVVMPPPSPKLTNRERLSQHVSDPGCASCHDTLDSIGFTFESFDASGSAQRVDHGKPVNAHAKVRLGQGATETHEVGSSAALTQELLTSPVISECFARHAFRYFSAQADEGVEAAFLSLRSQLPEEQRDNLFDVLLAYIVSDLFVRREERSP